MKKIMLLIIFLSLNHLLYSQLKPNQLRISGRNILDGNGNVIRLVGINHAHAWYRGYLGSALQGIRSWGANSVRVVLSCGYRWTKIPANEVSTIINQARSLGFKAIVLEVHDTTGYGQDSSACDLQTAVNYWREIKSVLDGNEDFVIINIGNEPWGNNNTSGWVNATKSAIQALRQAGFTHVIMCDAPCWGQDWDNTMRNNAQNVLSADSLNNTILSVHMYGVYNTSSKVNSYMSYYYNNNLPLCVGEFGHYHTDGDPDEQAIVSYAQQYGISIWGWSWCGNGGGVEYLDMVYNWNENSPTNWGSWFKSNALTSLPQTYTLSVSINPAGSGSVSLNPSGGTYTAGTQVTLTATANSGYVFSSWSGDLTGTTNPATITMNSNKSVTANFTQSGGGGTSYTLTVSVSPQGSGVVYLNPSQGVYTAGTQVTLTATANSGYVFSSWSGDLTGTTNPATITMNSNKSVTANFTQSGGGGTSYTLTVSVSPQGSGVVYLNPSQGVYTAGTQVTLTATANSGYVFSSWSGDLTGTQNPVVITMNSNKSVTANFVQSGSANYTLTINVSPQGSGVVYLNPSGGVYTAGTQVTLTATANSGYVFSSWSGDLTGTTNHTTITMNSNKSVTANFTQSGGSSIPIYTLTINVTPFGGGSVNLNPIGGYYQEGTTVTITAIPNSNYNFNSWSGDLTGQQNPSTIVMNGNKNITAHFIQNGITYDVIVIVYPPDAGFVTLNPTGGKYPKNTEVTLIAHPYNGYEFLSWSQDITSTSSVITILVNSNKTVQANFSIESSTVNATTVAENIIIFPPSKNPFYFQQDAKVNLRYYLNKPLFVKLKIYDLNLNLVRTTPYEYKQSGENYFEFNGVDDNGEILPTGLYLYRIESDTEKSKFNKLFIIR